VGVRVSRAQIAGNNMNALLASTGGSGIVFPITTGGGTVLRYLVIVVASVSIMGTVQRAHGQG
jgi:hypothetical protein